MIDAATRRLVRRRARNRCEYCLLPQLAWRVRIFHIEHIRPKQHGGGDEPANLCLACSHCNAHKGTNLTAIDHRTGQIVLLFHPRRDRWSVHFLWDRFTIRGKTAVGRATVDLLEMNDDDRINLRRHFSEERKLRRRNR